LVITIFPSHISAVEGQTDARPMPVRQATALRPGVSTGTAFRHAGQGLLQVDFDWGVI